MYLAPQSKPILQVDPECDDELPMCLDKLVGERKMLDSRLIVFRMKMFDESQTRIQSPTFFPSILDVSRWTKSSDEMNSLKAKVRSRTFNNNCVPFSTKSF